MKPDPTEFADASTFRFGSGADRYRFPFTCLDPTPGGRSLGRIEWSFECVPARRKRTGRRDIADVFVWARQTRDERYAGKTFRLAAHAECLTPVRGSEEDSKASVMAGVWNVGFCAEHGNLVFISYPPNNAVALVVDLWLSSAGRIYYELGASS